MQDKLLLQWIHLCQNINLLPGERELFLNLEGYGRLVGKPNNLIITRLDIPFAIGVMSELLSVPTIAH